jgi:hypothetical protein
MYCSYVGTVDNVCMLRSKIRPPSNMQRRGECVVLGIDAVPATEESHPFFLVGIALQYFTAKDIPFFLLVAFEILRGFL